MENPEADYHALCAYTLGLGDPEFIHQHVVDAYAAQVAGREGKSIGLTFALVGLFLHCELGWTGRRVQLAHMTLARQKKIWPEFVRPSGTADQTWVDVVLHSEGDARKRAISSWACAVWAWWRPAHFQVAAFVKDRLGDPPRV